MFALEQQKAKQPPSIYTRAIQRVLACLCLLKKGPVFRRRRQAPSKSDGSSDKVCRKRDQLFIGKYSQVIMRKVDFCFRMDHGLRGGSSDFFDFETGKCAFPPKQRKQSIRQDMGR